MPRIRYTGGSVYNLRDGPTFETGDEAEVDDDTAARLTDRQDFELADGGEDSGLTDDGRETFTPAFDPGEYNVDDLRDELDERSLSVSELVTLKAAEDEGKSRTTAMEAIQSRIDSSQEA